ncbi:hypothetical protein Q5P01_000095 [Channa striata]|uniref:Uncharacterized protein n=1 Tax=Channa striata TaxID=64152 RepID=A0AA88IW52_CHASR|nr:hypothetical protein Q5P01_000095 [Channa striata]
MSVGDFVRGVATDCRECASPYIHPSRGSRRGGQNGSRRRLRGGFRGSRRGKDLRLSLAMLRSVGRIEARPGSTGRRDRRCDGRRTTKGKRKRRRRHRERMLFLRRVGESSTNVMVAASVPVAQESNQAVLLSLLEAARSLGRRLRRRGGLLLRSPAVPGFYSHRKPKSSPPGERREGLGLLAETIARDLARLYCSDRRSSDRVEANFVLSEAVGCVVSATESLALLDNGVSEMGRAIGSSEEEAAIAPGCFD